MIKKILYIGFQYDYGKKESGYAINYKAWYENFIRLDYEVEAIFYEDFSKEALQKEILRRANDMNPDLVFFILQKDQVSIETLEELKRQFFFTANFFGDDHWRFGNFTSKFAPHFSTCITTDKFSVDKYKIIGQENIIRSQWASLNSNTPCDKVKYRYDVSFIGGVSPYRKWFVDVLAKKGVKVHCFGSGWNNGRATYEQMEEIFQSSKINLNISNSVNYDVRYLMSSLKVLLSALRSVRKNNKNSSQIKARNFEIPVQGGFQLTDYVPTIEEYFYIGKEVACYRDIDEAELLINYYLKHEEERESIKLLGVKKARKEHTFKNRIIEFMIEIERIYDREK
jgi:spore maturation protein CgeB